MANDKKQGERKHGDQKQGDQKYADQTIPVANLVDYLGTDEEAKRNFVNTVGGALSEIGFFALDGHGIASSLIDEAYQLAEAFFSKDDVYKKNFEVAELGGQRGFTSFGREHAKDSTAPDLKEFWHVGQEFGADHHLSKVYPANIWPQDLPRFKEVYTQLYTQLQECAYTLLEACALYGGLEQDRLSKTAVDGNTILRVIHYPPIEGSSNPASIRAAAHEDINLITLLCEATAGGLELLERDGSWRQIHALKGQIVVDAGDMLQNMSNGFYKSTTHRVVNPDNSRDRRFSMPFFVHPRSEVDLTPLPEFIEKTGGESRFEAISAGTYLNRRLQEIGLKK